MKIRILFTFLLIFIFLMGCASPPKKEQPKLSSKAKETPLPQPTPEVTLKELVLPQKEEAKKIPEKLFSFFARDASIQDVLLAFSRESELNIVMDPELSGKVTIDLKRVTLREALEAILSPLGWTYQIDGRFIKVSRPQMETRLFTLNYISTKRTGKRETYASSGGGMQAGPTIGQQVVVSGGGARTGFSDLISVDEMDLWREIHRGLEAIIFGSVDEKEKTADQEKTTLTRVDGKGKKLVINKSTGVIWVTDYPVNLNKVASYLEMMEGTSQRQVTIQARIMEVILSDEYKAGINWKVIEGLPRSINLSWGLTDKAGTTGFPGGSTGTDIGTGTISTPGLFNMNPFGGTLAIGALGKEVALSDIVEAISEQGDVKILSNPTISTLNNQKAIIRVGDQDVFFIVGAVATQNTVTQTVQPMTIDIGIILDVTPQIADDGTILMSIHPSISQKTGEKTAPDGSTFPLLSVRETDTTVKVKDGQTIVIAGLMTERKDYTFIGVPLLKSIPLFGNLFQYKSDNKRNAELVIMITPSLQIGKRVEDFTKQ